MDKVIIPEFIKNYDFELNRNFDIEEIIDDEYYYFTNGKFDILNKEEIFSFNALYSNVVGDAAFLRISKNDNSFSFLTSVSSKGFYLYKDESKIFLFSDENVAYKYLIKKRKFNLNQYEFISLLIAHQLCWNSPLGTIDNSLIYLPSGLETIINNNLEISHSIKLIDICTFLKGKNSSKKFLTNLQKIINTYFTIYQGETNLLYSGGIDSTLLWKLLSKYQENIKCLNVSYPSPTSANKAENLNLEWEMLDNVSSKLSINLEKIKYSTNNSKKFFEACRTSPRIIISLPQLRLNSISLRKERDFSEENKLILISGQNADTLHSLNTYAPSTEMIFPLRSLYNLLSIYRRFIYNFLFIKLLSFFPSNNYLFLKLTNLDSLKEHDQANNHFLLNLDSQFKKQFLKKRNHLFDINNFVDKDNKIKLSKVNKETLIRIYRHFRTIQNSLRIFGDYSKPFKFQIKKMPFMESPSYFSLITYRRTILDIFIPKRMIYKGFKKLFKYKYRSLMKKTSLQRIKTAILDLYQIKKKKSVIYEKSDYLSLLSFIKYTNQIYPFSNSKIKSLLCQFFNSEVIKDKLISILNLFDNLSNIDEESAFNEVKKISLSTDTKFLLRFLNLYIYINNLFE